MTGVIGALLVALLAGLTATPAAAASPAAAPAVTAAAAPIDIESVVGTISQTVRAQLPADPRLYAPFEAAPVPKTCPRGDIACVDRIIHRMTQRFQPLAASCDHDAVFSLTYLRMTERYRKFAVQPGFFQDPAKVNWQDVVFAEMYLDPYGPWHNGDSTSVPPAWRLAFAAADARQVNGSGDALLGMAAHIQRDLPFALWRVSLASRGDHLAVNKILQDAYSDVVRELSQRFDPTISVADLVPGTKMTVLQVIAVWRDKAYADAVELVRAPDQAAWNRIARRIERDAWLTAVELYLGTKYPVQALTVTRDTHCATHWNT